MHPFSEHTYGYDADDNDNTSVIEATNLVAHAARRQQHPARILKKKDFPKKSNLPIADPQRFLANRSTPLIYNLLFKSCSFAPRLLRRKKSQQSTRLLF